MGTRRAGNLPAEVTSFVNRRAELAELRRLLPASRLVTLTGVAGVGKTRLALAAGAELRRAFPDGVWLAELARVRDEALLAHAIAHTLDIHDLAGDPLGTLVEFLRPRTALLIVDNCEHVLGGCAALAGTLLRTAPGLRMLATSREALRLPGEHELRVAPLAVPAGTGPAEAPPHAVELFRQRAIAASPAFRLDDGNRAAVAEVCRRLEGIPLAIELAAVCLRVLTVDQLRGRLDDRFRLLTGGSRAAFPHQRTLRAAVEWSYELCDPDERTLWERVSLFGGEFDLSAVEEIYTALGDDGGVLNAVDGLVSKSVLTCTERGGRAWYRLLETLREYGRQRLHDSGEGPRVRHAYGRRYLDLAERAEREWFGPGQAGWRRLLHREHANLRVALRHFLDTGATEEALRLCAAIWFHWLFSGWVTEGRLWLDRALDGPAGPAPARARALYVAAFLAGNEGDLDAAERLAAEARTLAEHLGDQVVAARALTRLAAMRIYRGDAAAARPLITDALARFDAAGAADSPHGVLARNILAVSHLLADDPQAAAQIYHTSIASCRAAGDTTLLTATLVHLARAEWTAGDLMAATANVRTSVGLHGTTPIPPLLTQGVELMAWLTADSGGPDALHRAAVVLGAADRMWLDFGLGKLRDTPYYQTMHQRCTTKIRAGLGDADYEAAFARGAGLSVAEVCASITGADQRRAAGGDAEPPPRLTTREQQVADLVADGLSNREIAGRLVVSTRTAESHVQNILTKLGFTSRAQVAAYVAANRRPTSATAGRDPR